MQTTITPELIRTALQHIPASLPRDEWARICMAIKSEFSDETGRDLFTEWSATADGFDASATASTWRSVKAGGGVTIATLLHLAKQNGFELPKAHQSAAPHTPEALAQRERDRIAARAAEQAKTEAAHAQAADIAAAMWQEASETGTSPYLERKGVLPHGLRFGGSGVVFVPVRDAGGKLWNIQMIYPQKPADGSSDKRFLKGGRKSGLWQLIGGDASSASPAPDVLLIGEGYATAATLHEATGYPVIVSFDAGNLLHVAKALRQRHPAALLVLCGDDDVQTFATKGHNPGRDKATAAARAVGGLAVFPDGLPDGGSDFNDLHQHIGGAAGLDAVRRIVAGAVDTHQASQTALRALKDAQASNGSQQGNGERTGPQSAGGFDRFFVVDGDGVYFTPTSNDGDGTPKRVCGVLRVVGLARDAHDNQAALLLEFDTDYRKGRAWLMPLSTLAGDGATYRAALLSQGFMTPTDGRRRAWLTDYLQSRNPGEMVRHVPRVGWYGKAYVLPNETLGDSGSGERLMFHSEAGVEANFSQRGTLESWRNDLARLCVGNTRAAFAVSTAFAGPLLAWASGTSGGGVHYVGATSIGKTTCFLLAASVWGKGSEKDPQSYMQKWRATGPALEYLSEQHNDCTLILDELGQIDPKEAGQSAYMMADGAGKNRGKAQGGLRAKPSWRLLYLSSGELTLAQHMETIGQKQKGGQEVRLIPIPTEVREGSALECFHEFDTGHELSGWVQNHAARCYGVAGRAWLEYLVAHTDGLMALLRERMDAIEADMVPTGAAGQVKRGGRRFALIAAAGEMATAAGLTGWPEGEAIHSARACFDAWIKLRGGAGNSEEVSMLRQAKTFMELHGEGRFAIWHRVHDLKSPKTLNKAGYRRIFHSDGTAYKDIGNPAFDIPLSSVYEEGGYTHYYTLPEVFKGEICKGFDLATMSAVLHKHGCLEVKEEGRYSIKTKLPDIGAARCYVILPRIFGLDI